MVRAERVNIRTATLTGLVHDSPSYIRSLRLRMQRVKVLLTFEITPILPSTLYRLSLALILIRGMLF